MNIEEKAKQLKEEGFDVVVSFKGGAKMKVVSFEDDRVIGQFVEGTIDQIISDELRSCPASCIASVSIS